MNKLLLLFILLLGCNYGFYLAEPDDCISAATPIEDEHICFQSLRCSIDEEVRYSSYFCVCDNICTCFFAITLDKFDGEKLSGGMFFLSGDFCTLPNRELVLLNMNQEVDRMMSKE